VERGSNTVQKGTESPLFISIEMGLRGEVRENKLSETQAIGELHSEDQERRLGALV
jgi:hypothetical protein